MVESEGYSGVLLGLVVEAFVPEGSPLVVGIDETLERRYGKKISARGVYRDPVRSTHETFVKSSGLRWVCAMVLVEVPWACRVWALPFLSALAPSERYAAKRGRRHKKITEWAWQLLLQVRRWYPRREIVATADRAYASLELLDRCRSLSKPVTFLTRLRLDAALYEPAPPRRPGQRGRPRLKGERLPNLSAVAEDLATVWKPTEIANWYGSAERKLEVASETAVSYSTGLFAVPIRWVLVRDPQGEFKTQAFYVYRPRSRSAEGRLLVRDALAAGGDLSGGAQASRIRDAEAVVGFGDTTHHTGAFGFVLAGHPVGPSPHEAGGGRLSTSGGLVPQGPSDLRRCARYGAKGAVCSGADFLRVAYAERHDKSPEGLCGTPNRGGLLRGLDG